MGNGQMVIWAISSWTNERNQYLVKNVIKDAVFPLFKEEFILKETALLYRAFWYRVEWEI